MLSLQLERPLAFFDIESTGLNPRQDRIVELAIVKLSPDGKEETRVFRINPLINIPPEATAIHGITDADIAEAPPFRKVASEIAELLDGCDLCGFGVSRFDIPLLMEEFARAGESFDDAGRRVIDVQRIYHKKEPRDLTAALAFYCGKCHDGAHGAEADALATISVLDAQLKKYSDLPNTVEGLDSYTNPPKDPSWADKAGRLKWERGELIINFGAQNKGKKLRELAEQNPRFLKWILSSDFPSDTKEIVAAALEGKYPTPPDQ